MMTTSTQATGQAPGTGQVPQAPTVAEEDLLRVGVYRLLARLLSGPPDDACLRLVAGIGSDRSELGLALHALSRLAASATPVDLRDEYQALFIGIGRGELVPFGSFYQTGFLNEKPLAVLRDDLRQLGIERQPGNPEPEDHVASLCEVMAGLIDGSLGDGAMATQQRFFAHHLAPWAKQFFLDLERARESRFYAPVGTIGQLFIDIESTAFEMAA